jgi:O-acetyl-ADP-ribose deacetylase (regulator of RNase III)
MIRQAKGNLLEQEVDALVNTVNTVGVMGKGVALQFKRAFPENFKLYEAACRRDEVHLGKMFVTRTGMLTPRLIINFPTKEHWKGASKIESIRTGLADLVRVVAEEGVASIALPPLGCGNGGLNWNDVLPLITSAFAELPDVDVQLFSPWSGTPAETPIVRGAKPPLTEWRASLLFLLYEYSVLGFYATHLEAQKLLYFLKEVGDPIPAAFVKGKYGPYDDGMKHGLLALEGHYLRGFGEGKVHDPVCLVEGAIQEVEDFLGEEPSRRERVGRVAKLIHGFESPYGLELLASVHWVATHEDATARADIDSAVRLVHQWSERKRASMDREHIAVAWKRLAECDWLKPLES